MYWCMVESIRGPPAISTLFNEFYRLSRLAAAAGIGVQLDKHGDESSLCLNLSHFVSFLSQLRYKAIQDHPKRVIIVRMFVPTVYGTRQSHRSKSCSAVYMVKDLCYRGLSTPLSVPLFFEAVRAQHSERPACGARRGAGQAIRGLHDAYDRAGSTAEASLRRRWPLPLRTEQLRARIIQFSDGARREYGRGPFHTAAGAISVRLAALCWLREWHAALSSDIVELGTVLVAPAPLYKSWDFWQRFCARRCRRRPDGFDRRVPDADTEITSSSPALMVINTATERNRARRSKGSGEIFVRGFFPRREDEVARGNDLPECSVVGKYFREEGG
ncbi:hypothetical protein B0H11DRAFT_2184313 [Mycena galericulata]|nr:hypothetical protein B0H11DRAFT_2184313 [Mycena galericulata]